MLSNSRDKANIWITYQVGDMIELQTNIKLHRKFLIAFGGEVI